MNLVICSTKISQDKNGLYRLNDFHKAAGDENRHRPSLWVENQQTQELICEISKAGNPALAVVKGGNKAGTYVCKELVYAYAMWISAKFHLHVIQTFDKFIISEQIRIEERRKARLEFPDMTQALLDHRTELGKQTSFFHYVNECDLINKIVTGHTAKKLREKLGITDEEALRDHLTESQISAIHYLQRTNTVLIEEGYTFEDRERKLTERFEKKYAAKIKVEIDEKLMIDM